MCRASASAAGRSLGTGEQGLHGTFFYGKDRNAVRHRLLRRVGDTERAKRHHRDSDSRAGLYGPCEIAIGKRDQCSSGVVNALKRGETRTESTGTETPRARQEAVGT